MRDYSLSAVLGVSDELLGRSAGEDAVKTVRRENEERGEAAAHLAGDDVPSGLVQRALEHERELYGLVGVSPDDFDFEKVALAAKKIATARRGRFLKKELAQKILRLHPPKQTARRLGHSSVEEMLKTQDVGEVFSALRFTETDEWMHETFKAAYGGFGPDDFEERDIELRVLGPQFKEVAERYVAKKHHNVSHLKEFGVIFLNPIAQTTPGAFLRDFALLLHYVHEVSFYSRLFEKYLGREDFPSLFAGLLRGDVPSGSADGWLIVQRYLWKEDPEDPRLLLPRVNPEAVHWRKAQEDLAAFGRKEEGSSLEFWEGMSAVGAVSEGGVISFDLEDTAMAAVSGTPFSYHQREALWNRLAAQALGGYGELEAALLENMELGVVHL